MQKKFDAKAEAERLKAKAALRKRKRYSTSKLDKYKHQILSLRAENATLEQIQIFLGEKKIKCAISTIKRWLEKNAQV
ncbi:MAG: hypothetical protein IE883_06130 [Epsilonproteobacteria bacterium]|nr:hypothetical protein [Campylobacterota bacterium]